MSNAVVRFFLESVLVVDDRTAIVLTEKLVQRGNDLALTDIPLADQINVAKRAPSRPDRIFQSTGKASLQIMESGPEDYKLLVPEALMENRVQLSEVRPNSTVTWLGHFADEVLIEVDQQFSRARGHDALSPICHLAARQPAFSASPSEQNQCLPFVRSILTFA